MKQSLIGITFIVFSFLLNPAIASPLIYTEGTDLWNSNASTTLSNFDVGLNIVSGSVERTGAYDPALPADQQAEFGDYGDFWDAELPTGMQITNIDFSYSWDQTPIGSFRVAVDDDIISGGTPELFAKWEFQTIPGTIPLTYPLGSGDYYFGISTSFDERGIINWEWQITVASTDTGQSAIPEPATMFLFAFGLLGVTGLRRRKNR